MLIYLFIMFQIIKNNNNNKNNIINIKQKNFIYMLLLKQINNLIYSY